jgi:hypothetical protein
MYTNRTITQKIARLYWRATAAINDKMTNKNNFHYMKVEQNQYHWHTSKIRR